MIRNNHNRYLLVIFGLVFLTGLPYLDSVPIYDAGNYIVWLLRAVSDDFSIRNFNLFGHPSWAYSLPLALPQYLNFSNFYLLNLANLVFAFMGIWAFHKLLTVKYSSSLTSTEIFFVSLMFAINPIFLAGVFFPSPDFGVLVYFLLFLYFYSTKKFWRAGIFGLLMSFSKETGVALFLIFVLADLFIILVKNGFRVRHILLDQRFRITFTLPLLAWSIYLLYCFAAPDNHELIWIHKPAPSVFVDRLLSFNFGNRTLQAYLGFIFILNFHWIISLITASSLIYWLTSSIRKKRPIFGNKNIYQILYAGIVSACVLYLVTRHFTNMEIQTRYIFPALPLFFLLFSEALCALNIRVIIRQIALSVIIIFIFLSNHRTIDPVSRQYFGTYRFGAHPRCKINPWEPEVNAVTYNLEYINIYKLLNNMFVDIRPSQGSVFYYPRNWGLLWSKHLDSFSFKMTYRKTDSISIQVMENPNKLDLLEDKPKKLFIIETPNISISFARDFAKILKIYRLLNKKTYIKDGYTLTLYEVTLRQ